MDGVGEYFGYYGSKSNKLPGPCMAIAYSAMDSLPYFKINK